jgi:hypothetical protein
MGHWFKVIHVDALLGILSLPGVGFKLNLMDVMRQHGMEVGWLDLIGSMSYVPLNYAGILI